MLKKVTTMRVHYQVVSELLEFVRMKQLQKQRLFTYWKSEIVILSLVRAYSVLSILTEYFFVCLVIQRTWQMSTVRIKEVSTTKTLSKKLS